MNKLFLTTAVIAIGSFGSNPAYAAQADVLTPADFTAMYDAVTTSAVATGLHKGDFQETTRATVANELYRGDGSSLMYTVRRFRA